MRTNVAPSSICFSSASCPSVARRTSKCRSTFCAVIAPAREEQARDEARDEAKQDPGLEEVHARASTLARLARAAPSTAQLSRRASPLGPSLPAMRSRMRVTPSLCVEARVVGGDEHGAAVAGDRRELLGDRDGARVVEVSRGLVEDEQRRVVDERARQRDALALAAGEALRVDLGERRPGRSARAAPWRALSSSGRTPSGTRGRRTFSRDVRPSTSCEILEHEADLAAPHLGAMRLAQARGRLAVEMHLAARRRQHRADDGEQRRLAAAARPAHDHELAAREVERDVVEDRAALAAVPDPLHDVADARGEDGRRHVGVGRDARPSASARLCAPTPVCQAGPALVQIPHALSWFRAATSVPTAKSLGFPCWHQRCFHRSADHGSVP